MNVAHRIFILTCVSAADRSRGSGKKNLVKVLAVLRLIDSCDCFIYR